MTEQQKRKVNMNKSGMVYLVGAGPGDPGLLTLRGMECLAAADLVLYDGLVNPLLLRWASGECVRTSRIREDGRRRVPQSEINTRLISAARSGKTVVRLKGGDPFLFGRGSEEASALAAAGIPFEVVPGVTAAIAAGEYAGIALTHREHASAVAFVTGHEDPTKESSLLDYPALARFPGTLVFYMALHRLAVIADSLISAGKPAATPVAVVCRASQPTQQTVTGRLETIADQVAKQGLHPPSLIIIGECVSQRERIAWFEHRPLFGLSIGITRPEGQADPQIERCLQWGAEPVMMPLIEIRPVVDPAPIDSALEQLSSYDWLLFTSINGVESFLGQLWESGRDARALSHVRIACIGPSTAKALEFHHLRADVVPSTYRAESLAEELRQQIPGQNVLWVRANRGRDLLSDELRGAGANVQELIAYQNLDVDHLSDDVLERITSGRLHWIGLSSPSIARRLAGILPEEARSRLGNSTRLAAISPVTAKAAEECGLPIDVVAQEHTWNGIFDAIADMESAQAEQGKKH